MYSASGRGNTAPVAYEKWLSLLFSVFFLDFVLLTKWHSVVTLTYGLMDGLGYLKLWNAERSWVEMGFMGHVCLSAWTDMWALNRREGSWKDVWIAALLHSARWCHIWVPHSHLINVEMIYGKVLWPFKPCRETPGCASVPLWKKHKLQYWRPQAVCSSARSNQGSGHCFFIYIYVLDFFRFNFFCVI